MKVPQPFLMGVVDDKTSSKMSHVMFLAGRGTLTEADQFSPDRDHAAGPDQELRMSHFYPEEIREEQAIATENDDAGSSMKPEEVRLIKPEVVE